MLGTQVLLDHARHAGIRLVQVSTDEVYGDIAAGALPCTEEAPLRPSSPYSASKTGGDLQVLAYVRTYGVDALHHARREQLRPAPVPGEVPAALHHERASTASRCRSTATAGSGASGSTPRTTARRSSSSCARRPPGEVYNVGGQERENMEVVRRILDLTGASPDLVRHVADRPGHDRRYAVDSSKVRGARLDAARTRSTTAASRRRSSGTARTASWWEPIKSGEYRAYYEQQYGERLARLTRAGGRPSRAATSSRAGSRPLPRDAGTVPGWSGALLQRAAFVALAGGRRRLRVTAARDSPIAVVDADARP